VDLEALENKINMEQRNLTFEEFCKLLSGEDITKKEKDYSKVEDYLNSTYPDIQTSDDHGCNLSTFCNGNRVLNATAYIPFERQFNDGYTYGVKERQLLWVLAMRYRDYPKKLKLVKDLLYLELNDEKGTV